MPDRSAKTAGNLPVTRQPGDVGGEAAVPQQQYGPARQTAVSLAAETDSDVECLEPDNTGTEKESDLPTCPICLGEILGRWDKAVVNPCMHVFCLACLSRWSALKKSCPLCKSRIQGYMYNIVSETDYREQILPATPPRNKEPSPPIAARPAGARAIIDEPPAHHRAAQPGRAHSTAYTADRPLVSSRAGDRRAVFRQSSNPQSNEWVHGTWPPRRAPRQRQATTSSSQQRSEPRPYFYRVQAQAQSQAQAAARDRADVARSPQDAAEAWRRHIYVEGLYAQPMEGGPAVAVPPIMPEERKQHRLDAWVDRELRALLQTDDVAIVRAYVMGLVRGIGFVVHQDGAEGSGEQAASSARTDATAALKPFLHEHAAHFWHELRCFAAVSVSMQTYDRLVVYSPRQLADAHISQPSTAHASSSSEQGQRTSYITQWKEAQVFFPAAFC
ncbi:g5626 [Coccomyxa viridis]|uniref:RING-type E3 ubiquitin transferase n=1 Tax=Coccomyxa viridis TaxID=1274662 RepID=A0ABP1G061_9CHLO